MHRRTFLGATLAGAALAQGPRSRLLPNILFLVADDLNTDLGCYGHPLIQTPNLDALARRGVMFTRAYAQYPVCNPSRTSFLSSRYPEITGILDNRTNPRANLRDAVFLPEYLRKSGYFTARIGKIYHDGMDGENDWDVSLDPKPASKIGRTGQGRNVTGGKFGFFEVRAAEGGDEDQPDGLIAAEAVRLLNERRDKPFFLAVGFRKPHDPYIAPKKYFEPYPMSKIPAPQGPADDRDDIPPIAFPPQNFGVDEQGIREYRQAYAACISFTDAQVGKVLDALAKLPEASNTIVIFFGDHGLHQGEHGWLNKVTLFERSARVPLIIAEPGARRLGTVCREPVELLGLYPTLLDLTGLPHPAGLQGASLVPFLRNPELKTGRVAYSVVLRQGDKLGRSIHTERFNYIEWDEGRAGVELYDHYLDPNEYRNVAGHADYAAAQSELKAKLAAARPKKGTA